MRFLVIRFKIALAHKKVPKKRRICFQGLFTGQKIDYKCSMNNNGDPVFPTDCKALSAFALLLLSGL